MKTHFRFFVIFLVFSCWIPHIASAQDVLIFTGDMKWITRAEVKVETRTTVEILETFDIQVVATENQNDVKKWMQRTASDGSVNILILYGVIPTTIYPPANTLPEGSVAERWIETGDGNTILNHGEYIGYWGAGHVFNGEAALQHLMDIPDLVLSFPNVPMMVTTDGRALTPSLVNFKSGRPFPLHQLRGRWFAEKVLANQTGDARGTLADPVILRDGNRGRIAIVHQVSQDTPKGEVAAEIIANYLLADAIGPSRPIKDLISDAGLAAAVRKTLGLALNVPITKQNIQRLTTLDATDRQITNLTGLEYATQLEALTLSGNQIRDISPLAKLTRLQVLRLNNNKIRYVSALSGLTRLKELRLAGNNIRNVSALANLVNLEKLSLAENPITDISPLARLRKLVEVDIEIIPSAPKDLITDIHLAAAVRKALGLGANAIITEQVMEKLTRLEAREGQIQNLTGLEHATQLTVLLLYKNQIHNINPLAGLTRLKRLDVDENQISDINPLASLTQLEGLWIGGNQINNQDVQLLSNLTQLRWLSLYGNQISNIKPLASLTKLEGLWIGGNQIRDVSPLAGLVNLEILHLRGNPIQDTSPLVSLTKLHDVDIEISKPTPVVHVQSPNYPPIYWINTNNSTFYRLVGTKVNNLVPSVRNATDLAIDVDNKKLYWIEQTSNTTGRIRRANLDGTNVRLVKALTSVPQGIALDAARGKIYLTNAWGKIQRLDVDGSNLQLNLITGLDMPKGLALDVSGGKVYWTEMPGRIRRANLNGSNIQDVATGLRNPINIAIFGDTVYWTEKTGENSGEIRSTHLNGPPNVTIRHSFRQGFPVDIAVDAVENKLYWTTSRGSIGRSNLDGSTFQPDFITGLSAPGTFALNVEAKAAPVSDAPVSDVPVSDVPISDVPVSDTVISFSPSSVISPAIGEQLTLDLNITAGEAVAGYQVTVQFDATAVRYVESSNGDYLPIGAFFIPPVVNGNSVKLAATALTDVSNGDGTLATLTFGVIAAKASTLNLVDVLLADSEGDTISPEVEGGQITESPRLEGDVNNDGIVNIQDLVLVASNFGQTGVNAADINADGVVNITDLVKVAGALGNAAAAPTLHPQALAMFTTADVQKWLFQAQHLDLTDITSEKGVRFLEKLLVTLIPKETVLLPNYPNPFNPETWIPYQLAKPAAVTVSIYSADGKLVRMLELGQLPAGMYQGKDRAAYWDGKNAQGESVASGVYFYTLKAGDFAATQKMLIRK